MATATATSSDILVPHDARSPPLLEPDRNQIEMFAEALFRYAGNRGFVAVRSFYDDQSEPFRLSSANLVGGLRFLIEVAEDEARRAALEPRPVVFCPPLAVFSIKGRAREQDLTAGLALSVECDASPQRARTILEALLGPATAIVASGGRWQNGGTAEDKLHLHWRLAKPAMGEALAKFKQARDLATHIVGGDPSNKSIVHPIRWPGSWHRKGEPRLCRLEAINPDAEIDLDSALDALTKAAKATNLKIDNTQHTPGKPQADIDRVAAALAVIPNNDIHWNEWNRIGMATWRATAGSDDGFKAFDTWSQKSKKYDQEKTTARWKHYFRSPPTALGFGTLHHLADQATAQEQEWPDISFDKEGTARLKRTYRNARVAILKLGVICSYDEFHDRMLVGGNEINQWAGELSDAVNVILRQMIVEHFDFDPGKDSVCDAATELCLENRFDPIVDYLNGLDWDGTPRLAGWLITYMGAADTPLNRAVGKLTLVAAVRRVRQPGCKFDQIPVLEGLEGTDKSTSIEILAGTENFSDQTILTASDKEQQELVRGVWLFEIADLAGMRRSEVEKVKAFASRTHDRARPAYGRRRIDAARRCIFIGTTNDDEYLKSETGNRRIWPVRTGTIDVAALRRDRDQLWAEAAEVEAGGISLVLPRELWGKAAEAQDERRQHDPWDDILAGIPGHSCVNEETGQEEERIRSDELLKNHLEIPPGRSSNADTLRLKRVMRRLGWEGPKKLRFVEGSKRGYFRKFGQVQK
jgi:hypothetical protein